MTSLAQLALLASVLVLACRGQVKGDETASPAEKLSRLLDKQCGEQSRLYLQQKIIGGEQAELGAYPWMAAIGYTRNNNQTVSWDCGGTLISDQYVITAAHCLHPSSIGRAKLAMVLLGALHLDDSVKDGTNPQRIPVGDTIVHEKWDNKQRIYDIGLIKLERKIQFTDLMKPICLPPPALHDKMDDAKSAIVIGWGLTIFGDHSSRASALQEAEVDIQDLDECRRNLTSKAKDAVIDKRVLCASAPGKDTCQGDAGSPLMKFEKLEGHLKVFLLGISTYGYKCAEPGYPGVYTRVSEHMPWIIEHLDI